MQRFNWSYCETRRDCSQKTVSEKWSYITRAEAAAAAAVSCQSNHFELNYKQIIFNYAIEKII